MNKDRLVIASILLALLALVAMAMCNTMDSSAAVTGETYISDEIYAYCDQVGELYGISPELLVAIIERESSGKTTAKNGSCIGLMQVSSKYHASRMAKLGVTDLTDAYSNILVGADYLMELAEEYEDLYLVLAIYHGESKALSNYEAGSYSSYAVSITKRAAELSVLRYGE